MCPELLSNFPSSMKLKHLTELVVDFNLTEPPAQFLEWITNKDMVPMLTEIEFVQTKEEHLPLLLDALLGAEIAFRGQLTSISFLESQFNGDKLETLLFDFLPRFPNVATLNVEHLKIESFRPILERIEQGEAKSPVSGSLRDLSIDVSHILERIKTVAEEKEAVLRFLKLFGRLSRLGNGHPRWDSDIRYALMKNAAGRRLLESGTIGAPAGLPPALWANAIERASRREWWEERNAPATKVFYLVQNAREIAMEASERYTKEGNAREREQAEGEAHAKRSRLFY